MIRPTTHRLVSFSNLTRLCAGGLLLLAACTSIPRRPGGTIETVPSGKLEMKSPIDVAVAPIENASGVKGIPLAMLRESFHKGLVKRRYSPLGLEYTDRKVVDAAYKPGSLQEEAVLQIKIERWDTSLWASHDALTIKAEARLIDAQDPKGGDLWIGRVEQRFDFGQDRERFATEDPMWRFACDQIASEVLAALPARNAAPGHAAH